MSEKSSKPTFAAIGILTFDRLKQLAARYGVEIVPGEPKVKLVSRVRVKLYGRADLHVRLPAPPRDYAAEERKRYLAHQRALGQLADRRADFMRKEGWRRRFSKGVSRKKPTRKDK